jgi:putative ABC transport system ATP-binding protein
MNVLEAKAAGVRYGRDASATWALRKADVSVRVGEMLAVVGASGSGKSTLMYALSGLIPLTQGSLWDASHRIDALSPGRLARWRRDNVGFIFQSYNLVPYLSVRENVGLPARLAGRDANVDEALAAVGLADYGKVRPDELSGGQQQRVAVARVLASPPTWVFADEPTGALDVAAGLVVLDRLRAIPSSQSAVVLVTHDLRAAARADRALIMRDGVVIHELAHPSESSLFALISGETRAS